MSKYGVEVNKEILFLANNNIIGLSNNIEIFNEINSFAYEEDLFRRPPVDIRAECHRIVISKDCLLQIFEDERSLFQINSFDISFFTDKKKFILRDCWFLRYDGFFDSGDTIAINSATIKVGSLVSEDGEKIEKTFVVKRGMKLSEIPIEYIRTGLRISYEGYNGIITEKIKFAGSDQFTFVLRLGNNILYCNHDKSDDLIVC